MMLGLRAASSARAGVKIPAPANNSRTQKVLRRSFMTDFLLLGGSRDTQPRRECGTRYSAGLTAVSMAALFTRGEAASSCGGNRNRDAGSIGKMGHLLVALRPAETSERNAGRVGLHVLNRSVAERPLFRK
jgi:hypothetical protein